MVGGDSDYMPLSYKVKAAGRTLIGIGSMRSTNQHLARSCHEFKFYEALMDPTPAAAVTPPAPVLLPKAEVVVSPAELDAPSLPVKLPVATPMAMAPPNGEQVAMGPAEEEELRDLLIVAVTPEARRQAARELVSKAITRLRRTRGETWIQKARLRTLIQRMDPTFNESNFGFRSFSEMIASMDDLVETRKAESDHELKLRKVKVAGQ